MFPSLWRRAGRAELEATMIVAGGTLVNVAYGEIYPADAAVCKDRIVAIAADVSE